MDVFKAIKSCLNFKRDFLLTSIIISILNLIFAFAYNNLALKVIKSIY